MKPIYHVFNDLNIDIEREPDFAILDKKPYRKAPNVLYYKNIILEVIYSPTEKVYIVCSGYFANYDDHFLWFLEPRY